MMYDLLKDFDPQKIIKANSLPEETECLQIIKKKNINFNDIAKLLNSESSTVLEAMALESRNKTLKRFGRTVSLYTPIYLSSECVNSCIYCSFNHNNQLERKTLSFDELEKECIEIKKFGFDSILLVSGESKKHAPVDYLNECIKIAKKHFSYTALEIYPVDFEDYQLFKQSGVDGVTLYQETYNETLYPKYHLRGPKTDFKYRIGTMERAGKAQIKKLNIGALLGLNDWKEETLYLIFHLQFLKKHFWESELAVSFPRIRKHAGSFNPPFPVTDQQLVKMMLVMRLFDETLGLLISTRENAAFRNSLLKLGITSMSAGSKTSPGGHIGAESQTQFEISDDRTPLQIQEYLAAQGYEPVYKDWEQGI
ncbi:MAG TPA: 2-iminoacetate synthase ThiH [Spirochaetia bacterium]|nr:MAG: thiamine biosynthesis protein ThiH [Spirochaetes bacterium GWB1_36_13]HCL55713.1 2-iminoacetate synthase ThiH [Spirochaetia bacterium]